MSLEAMETTQTPELTIQQWFVQLQAQLVAVASAEENTTSSEEKRFLNEPIFDGEKLEELRTCIIQLHNNRAAQPQCYPNEQACF